MKKKIRDFNGWTYVINETEEWPKGTAEVLMSTLDPEHEGGTFDPFVMQVDVLRCQAAKNLTKLSAQEVFAGFAQHAAILDVSMKLKEEIAQASITLFQEEVKYLFRNDQIFTHTRDKTLMFKIKFHPTRVNSEAGQDLAPPRVRAILADNLWFATHILTHVCRGFCKGYKPQSRRDFVRGSISADHVMQVVEINHLRVPDNTFKLSQMLIDSSEVTENAKWIFPKGFLYAAKCSPPLRMFAILLYPDKIEVLGLLQCKIKPRPTPSGGELVETVFPIKFSMPTWTRLTGPSLTFSYTKFGLEEVLLFNIHCNKPINVYRTLDQEDFQREGVDSYGVAANEILFFPTFYHNFDNEPISQASKFSFPVEHALSSHQYNTGMVLPIKLHAPPHGNSQEALRTVYNRLKSILLNLKYYSVPVAVNPSKRGIEASINKSSSSPILIRLVLPIPKTLQLTQRYFEEVEKSGRHYLCYGAIVMLVQNNYYPRRWIASLMGHRDHWPDDKTGQDLGTEIVAFDVLVKDKLADNVVYHTLKELCTKAYKGAGYVEDIKVNYKHALANAVEADTPLPRPTGDLLTLYHAYIRPCRICIMGPYTEPSNRVLRENVQIEPSFMRATFHGNDGQKIFYSEEQHWLLLNQMRLIFRDGFKFGSRLQTYLAYSTSQLRSVGFWAFCDAPYGPVEKQAFVRKTDILRALGDFRDPFIGKQAARLGQCFSSTRHATDIPLENSCTDRDIECIIRSNEPSNGSFCFTDGVGSYGVHIGRSVAINLKLESIPSGIQVRYKGAKGMLVLDNTIAKRNVKLRKSQTKFYADHRALEVCEHSKPFTLQLNKALILLLQTLGVPDNAFLEILEAEKDILVKILASRDAALEFLISERLQSLCDLVPLVTSLVRSGFDIYSTPLLRHSLRHFRRWLWRNDYQEFRIPIKQGILAFGVNDNSKKLRYDCGEGAPEVFLQISRRRYDAGHEFIPQQLIQATADNYYHAAGDLLEADLQSDFINGSGVDGSGTECGRIIEGWVLITRSPGHDPGDVILAKAVQCPELAHLVNCLVFPGPGQILNNRHPGNGQHPAYLERGTDFDGCRDIPNMLSGGDLDGDMFQVIWDPQFVNPILAKFLESEFCPNPPADYTIPYKQFPARSEKIQFIQPHVAASQDKVLQYSEWFVKYHQFNNLGMICNTWLKRMMSPDVFNGPLAYDPSCKILAECASTSVDFAKSGRTVKMPKLDTNIPGKPYFMVDVRDEGIGLEQKRKWGHVNTECHASILGKLWDRIEEYRKPYISESCCILTLEAFYRNRKEKSGHIALQFGNSEVLASRLYNSNFDDIEFEAWDEAEKTGEVGNAKLNLSRKIQYTGDLSTYFFQSDPNSSPLRQIKLPQSRMRSSHPRSGLDWNLAESLQALCRIDFQGAPSGEDSRRTKIEIFVTRAYPPTFTRETFTLFDDSLNPIESVVNNDDLQGFNFNRSGVGRMVNGKEEACPSIFHDPRAGSRCLIFGIRPVHTIKGKKFIIQNFHAIVRDRSLESSNIIGISNEVSMFELELTNREEQIDAPNPIDLFQGNPIFPRLIDVYEVRPNIYAMSYIPRDMDHFNEQLQKYKKSLDVAKTIKNHQTSIYRALLIVYHTMRSSRAHKDRLPDVLRIRNLPNGTVCALPFVEFIVSNICTPLADFKSLWSSTLQNILTNHILAGIFNDTDFGHFFILFDKVKNIVYSSRCKRVWLNDDVKLQTSLPADWEDFVCDNHYCVLLWRWPRFRVRELPSITMSGLGMLDKISACTKRKVSISHLIKSFFVVPELEPSQLSPETEWLFLKNYAKLLFCRSPTVTPQIQKCLEVYLWIPSRRRVESLKVSRDLDFTGQFSHAHDMRRSEDTPQGSADNRWRNDCHISFTYADLYTMIKELRSLCVHSAMEKINPQFTTQGGARGIKLVIDRRLIHKDAGDHLLFATRLCDHYQSSLRQMMVEIGLTPHLHEVAAVTGCLHGDTREGERKLRLDNGLKLLVNSLRARCYDTSFGTTNKQKPPLDPGLNNVAYEARASAAYIATALHLRGANGIPWHPLLFCNVSRELCEASALDYQRTRQIVLVELLEYERRFFEQQLHELAMCSTPFMLYGAKLIDRMNRVQSFYFAQRARLKTLSAMWLRLRALLSYVVKVVIDNEQQLIVMTVMEHKSIKKSSPQENENALNITPGPIYTREKSDGDLSLDPSWSPEPVLSTCSDLKSALSQKEVNSAGTALFSSANTQHCVTVDVCLYEFVRAEVMDFAGRQAPELIQDGPGSPYAIHLNCRCKGKLSTAALTKTVLQTLNESQRLGAEMRDYHTDWTDYELSIENESLAMSRISCFCVDPLVTAELVNEGGSASLWFSAFAAELNCLSSTETADGWTPLRPISCALSANEEAIEHDEVFQNDELIEQLVLRAE